MNFRKFGNTGVNISVLGFGTMRFPGYEKNGQWYLNEEECIHMLDTAVEKGVNYIDTAKFYCHGNSELIVGKAIKKYRDKVYISTKLPLWEVNSKDEAYSILNEQIEKLGNTCIDFYHLHAISKALWEEKVLKYNIMDMLARAKSDGLIKHISFSFHDNPEVMKEIVDTGLFETLLCQYNMLDRINEEAMEHAARKGLGVVVMGPVAGGRLSYPSGVFEQFKKGKINTIPELALRFVLSNPNVSCALSGMGNIDMVNENIATASDSEPLSLSEIEGIKELTEKLAELSRLYCTGCNYCMPCPQKVNIPGIFSLMNHKRVYDMEEYAKKQYAELISKQKSGDCCISCGKCLSKCPQKIDITARLEECHRELC